ncbi:MAG TPA: putative baseplate assembly protein [Solirubrobacteraceae bacterium]|nr:putative baseplate assembly protein [Solirubrobacteraceae bacterium]
MLSDIVLDDLRFQELVSEARTRISRHAPAWTEHNVSDPGITLIELFAWFTDILLYRVNRIPEQLHLALLKLVGVTPAPPRQAHTGIRFVLERPTAGLTIPEGTEVAAPRTTGQDAIVFRTTESLTFPSGRLSARMLEPTAPDHAVLLGFDQPLSGLVIRLELEASPAEDVAGDARLAWEASGHGGGWSPATVIEDETDGLRRGSGAITLVLPAQTSVKSIGEHELHWLRCRAGHRPAIGSLGAFVVGATVPAVHAALVSDESLGPSEGVPGVIYPLRHRPVLTLEPGETLQVREPGSEQWIDWEPVASFQHSGAGDRHFMVDLVRGEVRFGPAIRQPDGGWRRFGAIPTVGAALRFTRYRHGGGLAGNVATGALTVLSSSLSGVASVSNPWPAEGGADAESLESARRRASLELRARTRAVTVEDFERLTLAASPRVARALCSTGEGPVRVRVVPRVESPDRVLTLDELAPDRPLMERLAERLEVHRLVGTSILLAPAQLRGVSVAVEVGAAPLADLDRVRQDVEHALYTFLNPLVGGSPDGPGAGWPAGRALNQGELFGIVYGIAGVRSVSVLRVYETDLRTGEQAAQPTESHLMIGPDELIASGRHFVRVVGA